MNLELMRQVNDELINSVKEDLLALNGLKEELLHVWQKVPERRKGEFLALLLDDSKEWQSFYKWGVLSSDFIAEWILGRFKSANAAFPEIEIPKELECHRDL
jgi:hypothetical protein